MSSTDELQPPASLPPVRRGWRTADVVRIAFAVLAVWFGLQLLWSVRSLVFLVFLATLFGLAVGRGVDVLTRYRIRAGVASALIVLGTLAVIGGALAWTAPTLVREGRVLKEEVPAALSKLEVWLDSRRGGIVGTLLQPALATDSSATTAAPERPTAALTRRLSEGLGSATTVLFSFLSNTLAAVTGFVLLVFLAMYIGAEPEVYRGWILAVGPASSRAQVRIVLAEMASVLRKWLVTQLVAMAVIGTVSMVVLLVLDVKAAFALAFIAGLLEFIPTVGPILSAVPAVLMGFVDSPEKALAVVVAYWGIQFIENNLLIPYLMRGEMDLPPAITLVAQTLMTLVFGFLGLMVAVPLTAAILVPLRMVAERENALEKTLLRVGRRPASLMEARGRPDDVMSEADAGPMP
ncbi:MAG: AI-2E family transporter [Gemmatimonadaceae bacterium]